MSIKKAGWSAAVALAVAFSVTSTAGAQVSVTTYHNDNARTGQNTQETVLTPANVNVNQFGKVFTVGVDSSVYAQPLYVPAVPISNGFVNGTFNVLYVATEHDSVYAIDADSGALYWQVNLLPVGGRTVVGDPDIGAGCDDTLPEIGITGTPVIDPVAGLLYVVSKAMVAGAAVQSLHALDLSTGAERLGGPVTIQASVAGSGYDAIAGVVTFKPLFENQRAGLLLENGHVIIAWTSHCDVDPWHGWVMSYDAGTLAREAVFNTTPNGQEGGSWMSGSGVAADATGNLYLATGNGTWDGVADFSESIVKLAPPASGGFAVLDYFTPSDQAFLTTGDTDLGSGGPVLLPDLSPSGRQLLALMGKLGTIYVVDRSNLGEYCPAVSTTCGAGDTQIVQEIVGASYGVWGSPAYWNGNLYWGAVNDYLKAFSFDTGSGQISSSATTTSPQIFGYPGPTPSVSANGSSGGIVWALDATAYGSTCSGGANCQVLYAYDATNLGTMLYNSSQASGNRDVPGGAIKFAVPTVANGKVYVGSQGSIAAFGELTNAPATAAAPTLSPPPGAYTAAQSVTLTDTTPGNAIYFTIDGTTPTTSSTLYTAPFAIPATAPVQAIAVASGYVDSVVSAGVYIINSAGGTTPQGVDLTEAFNASHIYASDIDGAFTSDGGIDGHGNALSANLLGTTVTWNGANYAIGIPGQPDGVNGATIALPQGNFTAITLLAAAVNGNQPNQQFVLNYYDGTSTAYTQSISDWHTPQNYSGEATAYTMAYRLASTGNQQTTRQTGPYYLYGYSFTIPGGESVESLQLPVNANVVVLAIDVTPAGNGTGAATPTFSPAAGTYTSAQTVTIADATPNAVIYYTLDGSTPTAASTAYNTPLTIGTTTTIAAIATATGYTASAAASATYMITPPAAAPSFSPAAGTYTSAQTVTIADTTPGAVIHYTLDGSTPTGASPVYAAPISVGSTTSIEAIALASGYAASSAASSTYTITPPAAAPTFSPASGTYTTAQSVTLADATPNAVIYYTLDGSAPTTGSSVYGAPLSITASTTINAIATASGYSVGPVASASYTFGVTLPPAASPSFSPAAGIYPDAQSVTLSDATPSAMIYYTLDGSTPTSASIAYVAPIVVTSTTTINAIATAPNYVASSAASSTYTITTPAPEPTFSPAAGTYTTTQSVTLSDSAPNATIYFTTDGSAPTTGSAVYTTPLAIATTTTVNAIALAAGYTASGTASSAYTITPPTAAPTFGPGSGTYSSPQTVTLVDATPNAVIHYTTDGSTATAASPAYSTPIVVTTTTTLDAIAVANGYTPSGAVSSTYTITPPAAAPVFSPPAGIYTAVQSVALADATPNAVIHYTTDGSTPTAGSPVYAAPLSIATSTIVKAVATANGHAAGPVATASYTIDLTLPAAAIPTFSPAPGSFDAAQDVTLSDTTTSASIYYTIDGSIPTLGSAHYTGPIPIDATTTLRAIAVAAGYTPSGIARGAYVIAVPPPAAAAPVFNPAAGSFDAPQHVVLTDVTPAAVIHYTLDGSAPSAASPTYAAPLDVAATTTINAIAIAAGYANSTIAGGTYVIASIPPPPTAAATPTLAPPPGTFAAAQTVTISDATAGAAIYYTTNGTPPTTASTHYSGPISVSATTTLQAIATAVGYGRSAVGAGTYTIHLPAAAPTLNPAATTFTSSQTVTLADATPGAVIHYTIDGSVPDAGSPTYAAPLALSATTTVAALAIAPNYTDSPIASATYTLTAAPPTKSGGGGGALDWEWLAGLAVCLSLRSGRGRLPR